MPYLIGLLDYAFQNNKNLVLFGSKAGRGYDGNSMYTYEHILSSENNLEPVYMIRDENLYKSLREQEKPVAKLRSLKGAYLLVRADTACHSDGLTDIAAEEGWVPQGTTIVYLRHGEPVKFGNKCFSKEEIRQRRLKNDYFITTSRYMIDIYKKYSTFNINSYQVTGYPRNDILFTEDNDGIKEKIGVNSYDNILLYAPTKRLEDRWEDCLCLFPFFDYDSEKLQDLLKQTNTLLLIRLHYKDSTKLDTEWRRELQKEIKDLLTISHIELANQNQVNETNKLLPYVDALVTDYSSIYHDFLLLDRPLAFIPYDYEKFNSKVGFKYDYFENLPGHCLDSYEDFEEFLYNFISNEDQYLEDRRELCEKIHKYQDGDSSARVTELIKDI